MADFTFALQRLLNQPLFMKEDAAAMIVAAVQSRLNISTLRFAGQELDEAGMQAMAAAGRDDADQRRATRGQHNGKIFENTEGIAIIPIEGTLVKKVGGLDPYSGMTGYNQIETKILAAAGDRDIKGTMLLLDSGGGEAAGMLTTAKLISMVNKRAGGKPIWGIAADHAYSAAFGILASCDRRFVSETGGVGSVGVIALHANMSAAAEKQGVEVTVLRSGEQKARFNQWEKLDSDTRAHVQGQMDAMRDAFVDHVATQFGLSKKNVRGTEGLDYMGVEARAIGFVDEVANEHVAFAQFLRKLR